MPTGPGGEAAGPEHERAEAFGRVYLQGGWCRHLPVRAISPLEVLVTRGPLTLDELDADLASADGGTAEGLAATAWEPLEQWTDDELLQLGRAFPGHVRGGEPQTAGQAMAEDRQQRAAQIAELDAASAALRVAPVRTMADLLEFMVACTVVIRSGDGGHTRYALNPQAALPAEVLPLPAGGRQAEDELRWCHLHEPTAQRIIGLFRPDDPGRLDVKRTSVQLLARELGVDAETARAGLAVLLREPDFTASCDPERVPGHKMFDISVDWQIFAQTRLSVRLADPSASD